MFRRLAFGSFVLTALILFTVSLSAAPMDFDTKLRVEILPKLADKVAKLLNDKGWIADKSVTVTWMINGMPEFNGKGYQAQLAVELQKKNIRHLAEKGDLTLVVTVYQPDPSKSVTKIEYKLRDRSGNEVGHIDDDIPYPNPADQDPAPGKSTGNSGTSVSPEVSGNVIEIEGETKDTLRLVGQPYKLQILVEGKPQPFFVSQDSTINSPRVSIPAGKTFEVKALSVDTEFRAGTEVFLDGVDAFALSKYPGAHYLINATMDKSHPSEHLIRGFFVNEKESLQFKIGKLDEAKGLTDETRKLFDVWNNQPSLVAGDRKPGVIAAHFFRSYDSREALSKAEGSDLAKEQTEKDQVIPGDKVKTDYTMVKSFLGKYRGSIAVRYAVKN